LRQQTYFLFHCVKRLVFFAHAAEVLRDVPRPIPKHDPPKSHNYPCPGPPYLEIAERVTAITEILLIKSVCLLAPVET
jgi:hypothetical protein